ncbi:Crp/Fnr family transcriptional regulator [Sediminicola arcticus]|jgi:CRP/FNR family cyclic AMP-dependent transcriptional regulator|uniref:Crp/Fnr family transcriptional regulator n=1 Tax=Sediminicola arcticus TaxID=1574308 RepID=A0ABV2STF9_9FLAO|tara:strand:+ start:332 stop:1039 length:708 start_codon:yes stop_codon:yes gene_type:complete
MNIGLEKYRHYYETLIESRLFNDVAHNSLTQLLEISTAQNWPKKTCILDTSHTQYTFHILISGKIKVYHFDSFNDRLLTLFLLKDNDVFDIFSLMDCGIHKVYYEVLENSEVLNIPVSKVKEWMKENPLVYKSFLAYTAEKINILERYIINVALEDIPTRLARLLYNNMDKSSIYFETILGLSHTEIGALIGTTRAVVNRHIQNFKEEGILEVTRKKITITNKKLLEKKLMVKKV